MNKIPIGNYDEWNELLYPKDKLEYVTGIIEIENNKYKIKIESLGLKSFILEKIEDNEQLENE